MSRPLEGLRVADFSWVGAGPLATRVLAIYGADVIKVESNAKIDGLRHSPPFRDGIRGVNRSGYFADRNPDKRSVLLNLKSEEGKRLARRLVGECDVVANNFTPGVMDRLGLGWDELKEEHPGLIYLNMSMHGTTGPAKDQPGYGMTIGAVSAFHHLCRIEGRPPVGTGTNFPDHIPNPAHALVAVLAALRHRRRTGRGQFIDLAQTEPMAALLGVGFVEQSANGREPAPADNHHRHLAPHGVFPCRDGRWIALSVASDEQWARLRELLGLEVPHSWQSREDRRAHRVEIEEAIASAVLDRPVEVLADELTRRGIAAGVVRDAGELVDGHPQLLHRGHWARPLHSEMGRSVYGEVPFRLSRSDGTIRRAAPLLGEHTHEVCTDILGLSPAEIAALEAAQVLW